MSLCVRSIEEVCFYPLRSCLKSFQNEAKERLLEEHTQSWETGELTITWTLMSILRIPQEEKRQRIQKPQGPLNDINLMKDN